MLLKVSACPQCHSKEVIVDYGPEFNLYESDEVLIGFLCSDCLHAWAQRYKLTPVEDTNGSISNP